jgi:hypothetical protein
MHDPANPNFCARCGAILKSGEGNFYIVRIEAFADPAAPNFSLDEIASKDIGEEIDRLIEQMRHMTRQDLMDQVYRRLVIHLCGKCYPEWIEHPAGR